MRTALCLLMSLFTACVTVPGPDDDGSGNGPGSGSGSQITPPSGNGGGFGNGGGSGSGGGGTMSGNGSVSCTDDAVTHRTHIRVTGPLLANLIDRDLFNLFGGDLFLDNRWTVEIGYNVSDPGAQPWTSDGGPYDIVMPDGVREFNLVVREPGGGTKHWFDVTRFNVSGSCQHVTGAFGHTPASSGGGNGSLNCSDNGPTTFVTVSGGILAHVFLPFNDAAPSSIKLGYGLPDFKSWTSDSDPYTLQIPSTVTEFNAFVEDSHQYRHWFDVTQFDVSGSCQHVTGAFGHTVPNNGNLGTIDCSPTTTTDWIIRINGVLPHLAGNQTANPVVGSWQMQFESGQTANQHVPYPTNAGKPSLSWQGDGIVYEFRISITDQDFLPELTNLGNQTYALDLSEYAIGSPCYRSGGSLRH